MMSQVFVTGPKIGVQIQLVKLENVFFQIPMKLSRRLFFLDRLDQLAVPWTDQVHRLAAWTNPDDHCQPSQQENEGNFHDVISKKALRRMKNQKDLVSEVYKASLLSAWQPSIMKQILSLDFGNLLLIRAMYLRRFFTYVRIGTCFR